MTPEDEQAAAPVPPEEPSAGALLQQARADLRLSVEEVAQKLRLAPKQILALESDAYERLPGPTYVRGYLRSYALLLGLSPETVIAVYNRHPTAATAVDLTKNAPAPQMSSDHHVIKITSLVVAGLVLGLAAVWWQGRDDSPIRLRKPPATVASEPPAPMIPVPHDDTVSVPAAPRAPATVAGEGATRTEREPPRIPVAATPPPPPAETVATSAGPRPLVLYFQQDSWADVRDGANARLLYTTVAAGRVIRLGGTPPFSVYLGNASGVRVEYKGKAVDLSPHQRGPIARLTLGDGAEPVTR